MNFDTLGVKGVQKMFREIPGFSVSGSTGVTKAPRPGPDRGRRLQRRDELLRHPYARLGPVTLLGERLRAEPAAQPGFRDGRPAPHHLRRLRQ